MAETASGLLDYATRAGMLDQASSLSGAAAGLGDAAITGVQTGVANARAIQNQRVEQMSKIISYQAKLQEMKNAADNQRIANNIAKKFGFLPLDPNEVDAARGAAFDASAVKNPPTDPSSAGRLATIMIGKDEFAPVPGWSQKGGMTLKMEETDASKAKGDKGTAERAAARDAILRDQATKIAEESARRDKFNLIAQNVTDPVEVQKYAAVQPTSDEVAKYLPEAYSYLKGDTAGAAAAKAKRTSKDAFVSDALSEMQKNIEGLRTKGNDWNPFNNDPTQLQDLTEKRQRLLTGGGLPELMKQYQDELGKLTSKAKPSKEESARGVTLIRRMAQLKNLGGK